MLWNLYIILLFWLGASVKAEEVEFAAELAKRAAGAGGKIKVIDVAKKESEIEVKEMVTLHDVIEGLKEKFPGLTHNRIPVCNSASPLEADFDALCGALIGTNVNCPVIVNCQVRFILALLKYISHNRGSGTWWQGMAAAIPIFGISTTICHRLPYQYLKAFKGPATPIF